MKGTLKIMTHMWTQDETIENSLKGSHEELKIEDLTLAKPRLVQMNYDNPMGQHFHPKSFLL